MKTKQKNRSRWNVGRTKAKGGKGPAKARRLRERRRKSEPGVPRCRRPAQEPGPGDGPAIRNVQVRPFPQRIVPNWAILRTGASKAKSSPCTKCGSGRPSQKIVFYEHYFKGRWTAAMRHYCDSHARRFAKKHQPA